MKTELVFEFVQTKNHRNNEIPNHVVEMSHF